ncbi:HAD family phosphatase [Roseibium polysiphoniae]|uniref:HAD family phosphatase n=1 Tax=Roseibium polysiphoniae TaxID=2571221 RepID=A0A944GTY1_9HYPH|nr:HAD family phosphatase [Roseibium polysiphoniae]MBS8261939.1 HAD family phosphatase [Roseibium polysiphoniae]
MSLAQQPIIFDCDGVLINSEVIYHAVEMEFLGQIGLTYEPIAYRTRFTGLHGRDFMAAIKADYAALAKGPFPDDFQESMTTEMYRRMETELTSVSGIHSFLALHKGQRAVASSSGLKGLKRKLQITELAEHFDNHIYSGDQVEHGKPAPDLFLMAADRIGQTPAECVVLEDSINGVKAGVAAGMTVWGFVGAGHADDGLADRLTDAGAHDVIVSFQQMTERL